MSEKSSQSWVDGKVGQTPVCELDLTRTRGDGDFSCPNCGVTISPEDETENVYCILDVKVKGQALEELVIQCNKCASRIRLVGFPIYESHNL